ncbi:MAG: CHAD domain-containing protein [Gemmatimonadaceae bacterium]
MRLSQWSLREPAGRAARAAALELLAKVRANRERLDDSKDVEALHDFRVSVRRLRSWLRAFDDAFDDTLSRKTTRRLHRIAQATSASRDLEVHLAWAEERRRTLRGELRRGADWLIAHLAKRKAERDLDLRHTVDAEFDKAVRRTEHAMSRYTASVVDPETPFAAVAARLIRRHSSSLAKALRSVSSMADRAEAHEARIAAKRLRYLLDPLILALPDAESIVDGLGEMQDRLGELHDAQLFGSEIATIVAERLADRVKDRPLTGESPPTPAEALLAKEHNDPVPGLLAFARRLRRAEEAAFATVKESWLNDRATEMFSRVSDIAAALDGIGKRGREITRTFLLRALPESLPEAVITVERELGFIPGDLIDERVGRESIDGVSRHFRIVKSPSRTDGVEVEDEIPEKTFSALWPLTKGKRIRASLMRVEANDQAWTVYQFTDRELVLATIELDDADTSPQLPDWIEAAVVQDVSDDESYKARALGR